MKQIFPTGFGPAGIAHRMHVRLEVEVKAKPFQDAVKRAWGSPNFAFTKVPGAVKIYEVAFTGDPAIVKDKILKCIEEVEKAILDALQMRMALGLVEQDALDKLLSSVL